MSKLTLIHRVPRQYDQASIQEIVRLVEKQANDHAEGLIVARHGVKTAAPTAGTWIKGDQVDNSNPAVVTDSVADYIIVGWICTASGTPGTWKERRVLVEAISMIREPTLGTEVAATSGTSIDFTGIPSWVKKIVIEFVGVSTSGTSDLLIQLGDADGVENTGYLGAGSTLTNAVATTNYTAGFGLAGTTAFGANSVVHGRVVLNLEDSTAFTWVMSGSLAQSQGEIMMVSAGSKSLSAALDRVRITTAGGTDTFDAGAINILYS